MSGSSVMPPPAHIDPRIRARRIEVQRGAGRRRLRVLVDVSLVGVVLLGFVGALRTPLLDVDAVAVTGVHHTPSALVLERSGIRLGQPLVDVDLTRAGARVAELPWVGRVTLHRGLDGLVELQVTERTPVAIVGEGGAAVVVDADGRALAAATEAGAGAAALPTVRTGAVPPSVGDYVAGDVGPVLDLAGRLAVAVPAVVVAQGADGSVTATLPAGITVRLGTPSQLDAKVRALLTVLDQVDLTCAAVIDVRAPGSPVLTREEGCS